jgi:hypothetical protein
MYVVYCEPMRHIDLVDQTLLTRLCEPQPDLYHLSSIFYHVSKVRPQVIIDHDVLPYLVHMLSQM